MATVSTMAIIVLATKLAIGGLSTIVISSGLEWASKKVFKFKKGGVVHESDDDSTERINRYLK